MGCSETNYNLVGIKMTPNDSVNDNTCSRGIRKCWHQEFLSGTVICVQEHEFVKRVSMSSRYDDVCGVLVDK